MTIKSIFLSILICCSFPFSAFPSGSHYATVNCNYSYKLFNTQYSCELSQNGPINYDDAFSVSTGFTYIPLDVDSKMKGEITLLKNPDNEGKVSAELSLVNQKYKKIIVEYDLIFKNENGVVAHRKGKAHLKRVDNQNIDLGELMDAQEVTKALNYELKISIVTE